MPEGLSGFLSSSLVLPASLAGALAALFIVVAILAWWRGPPRLLFPLGGLVVAVLAMFAVLEQISFSQHAAARRDLLTREGELTRSALAAGSPLACLVAGAGDAVEAACEKSVFVSAQSVAAAVMYVGARLNLLTSAASDADDEGLKTALASTRRAVELDRFGIAAHVLATRDGCSADKCSAFELVENASALKANLKAQVFDQYVSRYAATWATPAPPAEQPPAVSSIPTAPPVAMAAPPVGGAPVAAIKPGEPWDYPSADSIPAVSIMNAEPPAPKAAEGSPQPTGDKQADKATGSPPAPKEADAAAQAAAAPAGKPADATAPLPPTPPKRPQQQAAPTAAR